MQSSSKDTTCVWLGWLLVDEGTALTWGYTVECGLTLSHGWQVTAVFSWWMSDNSMKRPNQIWPTLPVQRPHCRRRATPPGKGANNISPSVEPQPKLLLLTVHIALVMLRITWINGEDVYWFDSVLFGYPPPLHWRHGVGGGYGPRDPNFMQNYSLETVPHYSFSCVL